MMRSNIGPSVFHTVAPINNVTLAGDARFEFAGGLLLTAKPPWVDREPMLQSLSNHDQEEVRLATHAFVVTYEAAALGDPDPAWTGDKPRSIQDTKYDHCVLGNLALWLSRPSPVHFAVVIHAPRFGDEPVAQQIIWGSPLLCHPKDEDVQITAEDIPLAISLHSSLLALGQDGAVWTAAMATWAGLQMNFEVIRFILFWIALEALFGPEDAREITYRLSQRVGFFLSGARAEARALFSLAKRGYAFRSKIVHGRWKEDADSVTRMAEAEDLVRRSLVRILEDSTLTAQFSGTAREAFLDDLVF